MSGGFGVGHPRGPVQVGVIGGELWRIAQEPNTLFVLTSHEIAWEIASGARAPAAVSQAVSRAAAQQQHVSFSSMGYSL